MNECDVMRVITMNDAFFSAQTFGSNGYINAFNCDENFT